MVEPETSNEVEISSNGEGKAISGLAKYKGGGTTCCIPTCQSNTKKNPELSFYQIPINKKMRKMWLHWIGRTDFKPTKYHRVCSKHFVGGKKTCLNNIPTVVEKLVLPTVSKPRSTWKCLARNLSDETHEAEVSKDIELVEKIPMEERVSKLQQQVVELRSDITEKDKEIAHLKQKVDFHTFSLHQVKNNTSDFAFYTGFPNYAMFKAFMIIFVLLVKI